LFILSQVLSSTPHPVVNYVLDGQQFVDIFDVTQQLPNDAPRGAALRMRLVIEFSLLSG